MYILNEKRFREKKRVFKFQLSFLMDWLTYDQLAIYANWSYCHSPLQIHSKFPKFFHNSRNRQADNIVVIANNSFDEYSPETLDSIRACFVIWLVRRCILLYFFYRQRPKFNFCALRKHYLIIDRTNHNPGED